MGTTPRSECKVFRGQRKRTKKKNSGASGAEASAALWESIEVQRNREFVGDPSPNVLSAFENASKTSKLIEMQGSSTANDMRVWGD